MFNDLKWESIPKAVVIDVMRRISDWLESGGSIEDDYIKRQIEYAKLFIKED